MLFCSGNRPGRVCFILPDIYLFFPSSSFSFRFECPLPSLYASRSSKRRIIVGPQPILLFRYEQYGLLPPSSRPTSPDRLCLTTDWTLLLENCAAELFHDLVAFSPLSHSSSPFFFSLLLPLELLSLYIFFLKGLFAALTAKLSAEDVSTPVKLEIRLIWPVENVLLLSSIPPAGKRWNHRQHSQTSGLIEQKKHDGKTEERSTFRAPLCNGVSAVFPSNVPYLETIS